MGKREGWVIRGESNRDVKTERERERLKERTRELRGKRDGGLKGQSERDEREG